MCEEGSPCDDCEDRDTCELRDGEFSWLLEAGDGERWFGFMSFSTKEDADNLCEVLNSTEPDLQEFFSEETYET